jgi:anti-sigma factor RsiW
MNCTECKHAMEPYLDGELTKQEASAFEQHLASCEECRIDMMSMDKCINVMRTVLEDIPPPDSLRAGVFEKLRCCDMESMCCAPPENKE